MMSKIVKAIDVEVNKRLSDYLVNFIKYNYENGPQFPEGSERPSDEDIEGHISAYMKMNPFSLEEKVVEKKRMGRPKKNEKETIVAVEEDMFGNVNGKVSELKLEHPNELAAITGDVKEAAAKPIKAPKEKKEKVVKEKVVKEKKEKVVKEKVEKAPKEKKEKVAKAPKAKAVKNADEEEEKPKKKVAKKKAVKNEEEENPYAINDDGLDEEVPKKKAPKEKKEKAPKEKKEADGEVKKRGRPKKSEQKAKSDTEEDTEEDSEEEQVTQLAVQLQELCAVAEVPPVKEIVNQNAQQSGQQGEDDEVCMEDYVDFEEDAASVKTQEKEEANEEFVKFTDRQSGKDYLIDKNMRMKNEEDAEGVWYAVKDAATRKVVGQSNLRQMALFDDDEDDEDDDEEEEEEEDEEEEDEED
jgi:hypothetical protein